jgi:phosphatidylserine/phosphatidylglycerophosphate/cardiolipin synthase-like enzyme
MKKLQKKITSLFFIFFFILLSIQEAEEYINFHQENKKNINYNIEIEEKLENFKVEDIKELENITIYRTPSIELLDQIVDEINNAQTRIYLETYILTETRVQTALKNAFNR